MKHEGCKRLVLGSEAINCFLHVHLLFARRQVEVAVLLVLFISSLYSWRSGLQCFHP